MSLKSLLVLFRYVTIKSIEKGELIIQEGDNKKDFYYIKKGLVRCFFVNEEGDEITFQLFSESHIFVNFHSLLLNESSKFSYQALERTKFYSMDYDHFHEVVKSSTFFNSNKMGLGLRAMRQAFQRVESFVLLSPEERYLKYMNDYPSVINRAPDKYIANVLGITPVSLSRIKRRIASKKSR